MVDSLLETINAKSERKFLFDSRKEFEIFEITAIQTYLFGKLCRKCYRHIL